jgi:hypothetical protein
MRHRPNHTYWKDHEHWYCGRHLPASPLPWSIEKCWLCPNKRPPIKNRPAAEEGVTPILTKPRAKPRLRARVVTNPVVTTSTEASPAPTRKAAPTKAPRAAAASKTTAVSATTICAWPDCNEHARHRSKYCSRNCSNKNARARHKTRGK